jgi:hypothetical protein
MITISVTDGPIALHNLTELDKLDPRQCFELAKALKAYAEYVRLWGHIHKAVIDRDLEKVDTLLTATTALCVRLPDWAQFVPINRIGRYRHDDDTQGHDG